VRTGISSAALVIRDQSYGSSSAHFALSDSSGISLHVVMFSDACFGVRDTSAKLLPYCWHARAWPNAITIAQLPCLYVVVLRPTGEAV
jgi:hypothetical protein